MKRTLQAVCALALAAAPLAAGPVYLPLAINETDGAYRRTAEVWVTNPDANVQGFVFRKIASNTNGTTRAEGDEIGPFYLAPGETKRFTDLVQSGFRGMLEFDGAAMLQFHGVLTSRTLQGVKVSEAEIPVLTHGGIYQANETVMLQGLEKLGTTKVSNLGFANLGQAATSCMVSLRQKDGLLIIQNVAIAVAPLSQVQFDDALGILGLSVVPEGARAEVSCGQKFFTWFSTYDDLTGAIEFARPSSTIAKSALVKPIGPGPDPGPDPDPDPVPGNSVVFERPGEIVSYPTHAWQVHNYRVNMPFGGSRTFKKVTVDFDFHVGGWDPHNGSGFHCVFYLQNGSAWSNMFGYVNSRGTRSVTVFQVNATGGGWQESAQGGSVGTNGNYHMNYVYDMTTHEVSYRITHAGGGSVVGKTYALHGSSFNTNSFFIELGAQLADEGPEAYTPGWSFSNLRAVFIP